MYFKPKIHIPFIALATVGFSVLLLKYPPYRELDVDILALSLLDETIIPHFTSGNYPELEWTNGKRRFWVDDLPTINVLGCEHIEDQELILRSLQAKLNASQLPSVEVIFFTRRIDNNTPPQYLVAYEVLRK